MKQRRLGRAFDAGVNLIDAAEVYPVPPDPRWAGATEQICGQWLAGLRAAEVSLPPEALAACDRLAKEIRYPME
jgi:aryl-alcohol dehydrogenase-like predicted oxidoreductase